MSELYLVLRSRLDSVAEWVELGTDVMKTARERLGLSYESVARQVPVSSKTYERYEKRGRVPRLQLQKFAGILDLEVEQEPDRIRVSVPARDGGEELPHGLQAELAEAVHLLSEVAPRFAAVADRQEATLDVMEALLSSLEARLSEPRSAQTSSKRQQSE